MDDDILEYRILGKSIVTEIPEQVKNEIKPQIICDPPFDDCDGDIKVETVQHTIENSINFNEDFDIGASFAGYDPEPFGKEIYRELKETIKTVTNETKTKTTDSRKRKTVENKAVTNKKRRIRDIITFEDDIDLDECDKTEEDKPAQEFFGNKIIIGNKRPKDLKSEAQAITNDGTVDLKKSDRYCKICCLLFKSKKFFDSHNSTVHTKPGYSGKKSTESPKTCKPKKNTEANKSSTISDKADSSSKSVDSSDSISGSNNPPSVELETTFHCTLCISIFSKKIYLNKHYRVVHKQSSPFVVQKSKKFISSNKIKSKNLNIKAKENLEKQKNVKNHYCTHCSMSFKSNDDLIKHYYDVLNAKKSLSDKPFLRKDICIKVTRLHDSILNKYLNKDSDIESDNDTDNVVDENFEINDNDDTNTESENTDSGEEQSDVSSNNDSNGNKEIGKLMYKCDTCYFVYEDKSFFERHLLRNHNTKTNSFKKVKFDGECKLCLKVFDSRTAYNHHIRNTHTKHYKPNSKSIGKCYKKKNNTATKPIKPKSHFTYRCTVCKIDFEQLFLAEKHQEDNHDSLNVIQKFNVLKANNHTLSIHTTIENPPVPIGILFKCVKCDLHNYTSVAAMCHSFKCSGPKRYWRCPDCSRYFKGTNRDLHEKQHLYSEKFTIYPTIGDNRKRVLKKFLSICPKCNIVFAEQRFWNHYADCGRKTVETYDCSLCKRVFELRSKINHTKAHTEIRTEDFVFINYEIPTLNTVVKKKPTVIVENKFERVVPFVYCETCNCYLDTNDNCREHFDKDCNDVSKTTCTKCGLTIPRTDVAKHEKLHRDGFEITDSTFYDMNLEQIDPCVPEFYKCVICMVAFESDTAKKRHECYKTASKSCFYCKLNFNEEAHDLHLSFHSYPESKKIKRLLEDDVIRIKNVMMAKKKDYKLHKCIECGLVMTDKYLVDHKKVMFDCTTLKNLYKTCRQCNVFISEKEFADHMEYHKNPKYILENMNIVDFDRKATSAEIINDNISSQNKLKVIYYQCEGCKVCLTDKRSINKHKCRKNFKNWCKICKVHLFDKIMKKHLYEHKKFGDISRENITLIPFWLEKEKKEQEERVKKLKLKNVPSNPHPSKMFKPNIVAIRAHQCAQCKVTFNEENPSHQCNPEKERKECVECENVFYEEDYSKHQKHHKVGNEKIVIVPFKNNPKLKETVAKKTEKTIDKLYKCICGLHFLSLNGIFDHFTSCGPQISKLSKQTCSACNILFTPSVLFNHLVLHHSNNKNIDYEIVDIVKYTSEDKDEIYKCSKCELHFVVKEYLQTHYKKCKSSRDCIKVCPLCGLDFYRKNFNLHIKKHHALKKFTPADFDIILVSDCDVEETEEIKELPAGPIVDALVQDINVEGKIVQFKPRLSIDNAKHTLKLDNYENIIFRCTKCLIHFMTGRSLKAHIQKNHKLVNSDILTCKICNYKFSEPSLIRHVYIHHDTMKLNKEDIEIKDTFIVPPKISTKPRDSFTVRSSTKTKLSNEKYDKNILYRCPDCKIHYVHEHSLYSHVVRSQHKMMTSPRKCEECDILFSFNSLQRHIYLHHESRNLKLSDIEIKDFTGDIGLQYKPVERNYSDLIIKKYNNKLFKCVECNAHFLQKGSLWQHMSTGNHNKPLSFCDLCGLGFTKESCIKHKHIQHQGLGFELKDFIILDSTTFDFKNGSKQVPVVKDNVNNNDDNNKDTVSDKNYIDKQAIGDTINPQIENNLKATIKSHQKEQPEISWTEITSSDSLSNHMNNNDKPSVDDTNNLQIENNLKDITKSHPDEQPEISLTEITSSDSLNNDKNYIDKQAVDDSINPQIENNLNAITKSHIKEQSEISPTEITRSDSDKK